MSDSPSFHEMLAHAPDGARPLIQSLLGCSWGKTIWMPGDTGSCDDQATQIVVLHDAEEGEFEVRLCPRHLKIVDSQTNPRTFRDDSLSD